MSGETHSVRKAIIMAAGIGKRLRPLTLTTPKPLIPVNGIRMIDSVIGALRQNGIEDIAVVVGYMKEQFADLPAQYPGLKLIENPWYDTCNNISSLYAARHELTADCMILDGDQLIDHPEALSPAFSLSGYNAVWTEEETDEWLMQTENGRVVSCSRTGGTRGWQLYSVSRWTAEDAAKLARYTEEEFTKGNRQIYWDDVPMFCHFDDFCLGVREMRRGDVTEIDSLEELRERENGREKQ